MVRLNVIQEQHNENLPTNFQHEGSIPERSFSPCMPQSVKQVSHQNRRGTLSNVLVEVKRKALDTFDDVKNDRFLKQKQSRQEYREESGSIDKDRSSQNKS
mmetsp:Transcript_31594/g.30901  ORF Transcript_31594/g.30901 Transcript_31594/m.30901 type:complete len:101 (-) Transcript_31594:546-848(-)